MNYNLFLAGFAIVGTVLFSNYKSSGVELSSAPLFFEDSLELSHKAQVELGRLLFYEKALSRDSTISCATCHKQELAFTDGKIKSVGIRDQVVSRNAPTLTNVGNRPYLLLDGVNPSLEAQTIVPIQEHKEFDFNIYLIINRLMNNPRYVDLALKGFGTEITHYVYSRSLAEFERTLISDNSPYDRFVRGDKESLNDSQKRGRDIFFNKLYCSECHSGHDLTTDALVNNGLYEVYADSGRMRLTEKEIDRAVFKVPTLRNIEVTAPYMHDGSIVSLRGVVEHYSSGGYDHPAKGKVIVPFEISEEQKTDLINFLKALTDEEFLTNPNFSP